jgi:diaminohydroxyphosphoribosylaminopyrimidine deaminase/5-amino-6-(5-phosphoribosylamino)uracil reductase
VYGRTKGKSAASFQMTDPHTEQYLARALELARDAAGGVSPRPPVGAVIVSQSGNIIGEGQTEPRPGVHAEVAAIKKAGKNARGATMYCTLEPHAHQGVAAPCTEEIISAGITRVVCPVEDPNPVVNGNGFRRLRSAGVEVITDASTELREQAEDIISGFAMLTAKGRPQFTLKYAMSLDGRIATSEGESQWITGEAARAEAHRLRRSADVLVTGVGTVLADNPRMTARNADGSSTGRPRLRVVLDTHGRMRQDAALLKERGDIMWVLGEGTRSHPPLTGVETVQLPVKDGRPDLTALAKLLGERGYCDVMIESGGKLAGAFAAAGLIDRVAAFVGPLIIGGENAPGPVEGPGSKRLSEAFRLQRVRVKRLGEDVLLTGRVRR